ncbi:histidine-type phosphatase [Segetibacter sp. 3557_3]|uniref:histidine-type phosphatase n=1 Tax=Segetibacter sp. 3557_3 TaxID=2547429 RepID=UPI001404BB60|nr:histidine-type phosphatase [Segetibacter sp. 3557_3]
MCQPCANLSYGTKTLYTPQQKVYAQPPKDYKAAFINYVGRHGARHLTKAVKTTYAYDILRKADSLGALTPDGTLLFKMVDRLDQIENGRVNNISMLGRKEQHDIGARMVTNYPELFSKKDYSVTIAVTNKVRTLQSANAFVSGLKKKAPSTKAFRIDTDDEHLRFYDLSPAYTRYADEGNWVSALSELENEYAFLQISRAFTGKMFDATFLSAHKINSTKFTDDVYGFAMIVPSVSAEAKIYNAQTRALDFLSFFTCTELDILARLDAAKDYFTKGPGLDLNGIQVKIAVPLLADFIRSTDEYINTGKNVAALRFSHAEAISPFAALLSLKGASAVAAHHQQIDSVWQPANIIPLSANIQWILYKQKNSQQYLIKFLLNESEVGIDGLDTDTFPYYRWNAVRAYYINKLAAYQTNPDADMKAFLFNLQ